MTSAVDEAFLAFVHASERDLRRTAYLLCGDWHRAEDATQTALYSVFLKWRRIGEGAAWSYARRAVINAVISDSRRPWRRESATEVMPDVVLEDGTSQVEDRQLLELALRSLPTRQRAVVVLRYVHDLDVQETAGVLRLPAGTVTSYTARALSSLRTFLTRHGVVRGAPPHDPSVVRGTTPEEHS